MLGKDTKLLEE